MATESDQPSGALVAYVCPECQTGSLRARRVVFAHWYAGHFITIPNFPGWVCDVCGAREYDPAALEQVQMLLGAELDLRRPPDGRNRLGKPQAHHPNRPSGRRRV
jgi:YgiT-type zinc finger domain-containing protein